MDNLIFVFLIFLFICIPQLSKDIPIPEEYSAEDEANAIKVHLRQCNVSIHDYLSSIFVANVLS